MEDLSHQSNIAALYNLADEDLAERKSRPDHITKEMSSREHSSFNTGYIGGYMTGYCKAMSAAKEEAEREAEAFTEWLCKGYRYYKDGYRKRIVDRTGSEHHESHPHTFSDLTKLWQESKSKKENEL